MLLSVDRMEAVSLLFYLVPLYILGYDIMCSSCFIQSRAKISSSVTSLVLLAYIHIRVIGQLCGSRTNRWWLWILNQRKIDVWSKPNVREGERNQIKGERDTQIYVVGSVYVSLIHEQSIDGFTNQIRMLKELQRRNLQNFPTKSQKQGGNSLKP